jgi:hypothetical protein
MLKQLLLSKRLFLEASRFAERNDSVSCGLAISLLQDAAEMAVWALVKENGIPVKDQASFTGNLEALQKKGVSIPESPRLIELNKARVNFKHFGNLPAPAEAQKFRTYVEDFLRSTAQTHLGKDLDTLSLVDLVPYPEVQEQLKTAEEHMEQAHFQDAVREASIARSQLLAKLDRYIPRLDHHIRDADRGFARFGIPDLHVFGYLEQYLSALREGVLLTLLHFPLEDYAFLRETLFAAGQMNDGTWHTQDRRGLTYDKTVCERQIAKLIELSIRIHAIG